MIRNKGYLVFGLSAGVLLVLLQVLHFKVMIRDMELEILEATIALTFLLIGIFLAVSVKKIRRSFVGKEAAKRSRLSDREVEVLDLLMEGCSNQEIADRLFVSLNTIKTHLQSIYGKLGVRRRTQAIQKAKALVIESSERTKQSKSSESMRRV